MRRTGLLLCAILAACGDDGDNGKLADAPPSVDAAIPPAGVIVTVTIAGVPSANQTVYFQTADSATTIVGKTDAAGDATAMVVAGSYVTVVEPPSPLRSAIEPFTQLTTFAGVAPGDHLYVDVPGRITPITTTINVSVPNEGNGYRYVLQSSCGNGDIGIGNGQLRAGKRARLLATVDNTVDLINCGGTADLLALGFDQENFVRSWAYKPNVDVVNAPDVTFDEWSTPTDRTFTFTAVSGNEIDFDHTLYTARGVLFTTSASVFFEGSGASSSSVFVPTPAGVSAVTHSVDLPTDGPGHDEVFEWGAPADYTLDYNPIALHPFTTRGALDVPRNAVTWEEGAGGQVAQFTLATYDNDRTVAETRYDWSWRLIAPYAAGKATYPVLPTTLFDWNPRADDDFSNIQVRIGQGPGGFDALRTSRLATAESAGGLRGGATGQIVLESVEPEPVGLRRAVKPARRAR